MSLISRAVTAGARLAYIGATNNFGNSNGGYTVADQKGETGSNKFSLKGLVSQAYESTVANLKRNIQDLKSFYLEDLASSFLNYSTYMRMNQVEWSSSHLWEVRIDGLPKPFINLTPISNATLSSISINVGTQRIGNTTWQYIESQGTRSITVTIQDDASGCMEEFLYQWMDEISGQKMYGVMPIEKAGKVIKFRKLSRSKFVTTQIDMYCIPTGSLNIDNNQSSNRPRTIDITFAILGVQRHRTTDSFVANNLSKVAAQVTENLARRSRYNGIVRKIASRVLL